MSQRVMQEKLALGWTQLSEEEICPRCERGLMKDATEQKLTWCVYCNQRVMTESDLMAELESTRRMTAASAAVSPLCPGCFLSLSLSLSLWPLAPFPAEKQRARRCRKGPRTPSANTPTKSKTGSPGERGHVSRASRAHCG